jgi:hypothetical protein
MFIVEIHAMDGVHIMAGDHGNGDDLVFEDHANAMLAVNEWCKCDYKGFNLAADWIAPNVAVAPFGERLVIIEK